MLSVLIDAGSPIALFVVGDKQASSSSIRGRMTAEIPLALIPGTRFDWT